MQERDIMRPLSSPALPLAILLVGLNLAASAQTATQHNPETPQGAAGAASQPQAAPPSFGSQAETQSPSAPALAPSTVGKEPDASDSGVFVFRKHVEEVLLHATVVDEKQRLILNLERDAFTVYENGKLQAITVFRHEDVPVAIGVVIDNSGSMREKRDKVNKAALNLVRSSNPQDQICVVNFNDEYYLDQDFTSSIPKLKDALEKVEARGGTALYDAVVATAQHLAENSKLQKKVLFVVTDGEDNASQESLEQAVQRLQRENGPTVYAIGLLGEERQRRARRALQTIAEHTGGIAFLPKTLDEVDEISSTIAHEIRSQYTLGYKPTTPKNAGGYRTIRVEARGKGRGKLTVRTRSGYYAGQEQAEVVTP
jgi:Ca-activated chloride channel homolog